MIDHAVEFYETRREAEEAAETALESHAPYVYVAKVVHQGGREANELTLREPDTSCELVWMLVIEEET